jgi:uncharacterized protein (TIGR00290 family)
MSRVGLSWSGGKDSFWALRELLRAGREVVALVTAISSEFDRVAIHGVRRSLVELQAARLGLPLIPVDLPWPCSNQRYEAAWHAVVDGLRDRTGITAMAFGDLFLADVRAYRERLVARLGLGAEFPLWGARTDALSGALLDAGVEARIVCLDPTRVDRRWAGAPWDRPFLAARVESVDPCGENGEFHTFVTGGPLFDAPLAVDPGVVVERDGFVFADLVPRPASGIGPGEPRIESPCRNVCRLGNDGVCDGCGRTLAEIAEWSTMTDNGRRAVMARVRSWAVR